MDSIITLDNFLSSWDILREHLDYVDYKDIEAPDGVVYPDITTDIPPFIKKSVVERLEQLLFPIELHLMFCRLSVKGVKVPHQAHSDAEMGDYSLMLYMNRLEDCSGGTSFLRHESGFSCHPINEKQLTYWNLDHNNRKAWQIHAMCEMFPNRAVIFPSEMIHRAEPIGGFGSSPRNGRLLLTAFFKRAQ